MREHLPELSAFLAACVFVAGAFYAGKAIGTETPPPCGDTNDCWETYYRDLVDKEGSVAALRDLKERYEHNEGARTFCHPLLHLIGGAAGKEFGSVAAAYGYAETFCRSGFHHGVLEGIFGSEGGDQLLGQLDSICADVKGRAGYSYDYFSCVHGIGHGLMAYFNHDLFESLRGCDMLSGAWEQTSCHGGVFMENVIGNTPEMPSRFLRDDDLLYPCTAVEERHRGQCYLMQTSHMLAKSNNDFDAVFALCTKVEAGHRDKCFQSAGRDVSGFSAGNVEAAAALCLRAPTKKSLADCFIGAAADFLQTNGIDAAREVCGRAGDGRELCTVHIDEQAGMI